MYCSFYTVAMFTRNSFSWRCEKTVTYDSAKCVPCNTRKCTHNGFVSDLLKWALKCRFYATGPRIVALTPKHEHIYIYHLHCMSCITPSGFR